MISTVLHGSLLGTVEKAVFRLEGKKKMTKELLESRSTDFGERLNGYEDHVRKQHFKC